MHHHRITSSPHHLISDERTGDLMREQIEGARTLRTVRAERKLPYARAQAPADHEGDYAYLSFGTDWGSIAGAWLTQWERTRDTHARERLDPLSLEGPRGRGIG